MGHVGRVYFIAVQLGRIWPLCLGCMEKRSYASCRLDNACRARKKFREQRANLTREYRRGLKVPKSFLSAHGLPRVLLAAFKTDLKGR